MHIIVHIFVHIIVHIFVHIFVHIIYNNNIYYYFLGGEKYDFHLLLKHLEGGKDKLSALARNTQRMRTIQLNSFLFLDSTAHLPSSLAKLAETLKLNKKYPYSIFKQSSILKTKTSEKEKTELMEKLNCNGFYPYSAFETVEAL